MECKVLSGPFDAGQLERDSTVIVLERARA